MEGSDPHYPHGRDGGGHGHILLPGRDPPQDVLRITKLTGSGREARATRGGRVILRRLPEIIYTAELLDANGSWEYGLTEDEVREAFSLITTEWSAGDS